MLWVAMTTENAHPSSATMESGSGARPCCAPPPAATTALCAHSRQPRLGRRRHHCRPRPLTPQPPPPPPTLNPYPPARGACRWRPRPLRRTSSRRCRPCFPEFTLPASHSRTAQGPTGLVRSAQTTKNMGIGEGGGESVPRRRGRGRGDGLPPR
jgi:hypothetical protein